MNITISFGQIKFGSLLVTKITSKKYLIFCIPLALVPEYPFWVAKRVFKLLFLLRVVFAPRTLSIGIIPANHCSHKTQNYIGWYHFTIL